MKQSRYEQYGVCPRRGFLPKEDPLQQLPAPFIEWEQIAGELPKLLAGNKTRALIESLRHPDLATLTTSAESERAMMLVSFIGHAYIWAEANPPPHIPQSIAIPWHALSKKLGRPPCLSYASYALHNWRRFDEQGPIAMGNLALLQNFLGGIDEEWFVIVHVDIEALAAPAIGVLLEVQDAVRDADSQNLVQLLKTIDAAGSAMYDSLCRMYEKCDPYVYFNRVRPYIHGWQHHPLIPQGLIYEGVAEYKNQPLALRGETGAQSTLIPSLDAVLGTNYADGPLSAHLNDMRRYMPEKHRAFLGELEQGPRLREFVVAEQKARPELRDCYNSCVSWIEKFREKHLEFAINYIDKQTEISPANPSTVGTGATPYVDYLRHHKEYTAKQLI